MKVRGMLGSAIVALCIAANGMAAGSRHYEGCVTQFTAGQMVVCTFVSPLSCNIIKLNRGTMIVSSGRLARPTRGQYVSVDTNISASGQPIATSIRVYPGVEVRTIQGFQAGQAQQVANRLATIPGVSNVRINTQLGEAMINFKPGITTPTAIARRAARNGIRLSLPG